MKKLLTISFFSAAIFGLAFVLGNAITTAFGPGMSGFISTIFTTLLIVVSAKVTEMRGVFTITITLFTILAIPTSLFGPPGPQKIIIGLLTGLCYDLVWELMGRSKHSLKVAAFIATALSLILVYFLMTKLDHPKLESLKNIIYWAPFVYGLLGAIGAMLGESIYSKFLKDNSYVIFIKE